MQGFFSLYFPYCLQKCSISSLMQAIAKAKKSKFIGAKQENARPNYGLFLRKEPEE